MRYEIRLHPNAISSLNKLNRKTRERLITKIRALEDLPKLKRAGVDIKKIKDADPEAYRLRVGDYRVIYAVEDDTVWITEIMPRGRAYRRR
jgi:mRNA interferase RelE/StbE